jgi:hypothetical protein
MNRHCGAARNSELKLIAHKRNLDQNRHADCLGGRLQTTNRCYGATGTISYMPVCQMETAVAGGEMVQGGSCYIVIFQRVPQ